MSDFDPYHKWFGIPKKDQPPHHYRLLGLELFESDADVIDVAANKQMRTLKEYGNGEHAEVSERLLNEVAAARLCLLHAGRKSAYDAELRSKLKGHRSGGPTGASASSLTTRAEVTRPANRQPMATPGNETPEHTRGKEQSQRIVLFGGLSFGLLLCIVLGLFLFNGKDDGSKPFPDAGALPREVAQVDQSVLAKEKSSEETGVEDEGSQESPEEPIAASDTVAAVETSGESMAEDQDDSASTSPDHSRSKSDESETGNGKSELAAVAEKNVLSGAESRTAVEPASPTGKAPQPDSKPALPSKDAEDDPDANNKLSAEEAFTLRRHDAAVTRVTFHPLQPLLCSTGKDGRVLLWNLEQRSYVELAKFKVEAWAAKFSPNGTLIAYGNRNPRGSVVIIKNLASGKVVKQLGGFKDGGGTAVCMAFSPDALLLVVGQDNGAIRLWETAGYHEAAPLLHGSPVYALAFGAIEKDPRKKLREYLLAAGARNGILKTYRATFQQEKKGVQFEFEPMSVEFFQRKLMTAVRFSPDGKLLGSAHHGGTIALCDPETGNTNRILRASDSNAESISFHPTRPWIVTAHWQDHCARIWNVESGQVLCELKGHTDGVQWAEFSRDGRQVATASGDFSVKLWNLEGPGIAAARGPKLKKPTPQRVGD